MNETEKRIIQLIDEHREELITMGNELYTRAERGFAEVNTSAFIADKLKSLGLTFRPDWPGRDCAPPPEKRAVSMWL